MFRSWCDQNLIPVNDVKLILTGFKNEDIIKVSYPPNIVGANIQLLQNFLSWYEKLIVEYNSSIDMLSEINFLKILDVLLDINDQIQISKGKTITLKIIPQYVRFSQLYQIRSIGSVQNYSGYRKEACEYLSKTGVIITYDVDADSDYRGYGYINMAVNLAKFDSIFNEYKNKYAELNEKQKNSEEVDTILYKMTYEGVQFKVNGITLTKPHADSENDLVIGFLINKGKSGTTYRKDELDKIVKVEGGIGKTLIKIVENLTPGAPNIRKLFFKVIGNTITFYNPVNKARLKEIGVSFEDIEKELQLFKEEVAYD